MKENAAEIASGIPCPANLILVMFGHCRATPVTFVWHDGGTPRQVTNMSDLSCQCMWCDNNFVTPREPWHDLTKSSRSEKNIFNIVYFKKVKNKNFQPNLAKCSSFWGTRFQGNVQWCTGTTSAIFAWEKCINCSTTGMKLCASISRARSMILTNRLPDLANTAKYSFKKKIFSI